MFAKYLLWGSRKSWELSKKIKQFTNQTLPDNWIITTIRIVYMQIMSVFESTLIDKKMKSYAATIILNNIQLCFVCICVVFPLQEEAYSSRKYKQFTIII